MKRPIWQWALAAIWLLPATAQAQTPPQAGPPLRASWVSDRMAYQVGDIVTIIIDELTLASADRNEVSSRERARDVSLSLGTGGSTAGGSLRTGNDRRKRMRGESSRRERFSAELSARVMEVTPRGVLRLEAVKKLQIDDHEQEVVVRGWVRAEDVSVANTVDSWRIADAEIRYGSNGELGKTGGIWSKLLDLIIP